MSNATLEKKEFLLTMLKLIQSMRVRAPPLATFFFFVFVGWFLFGNSTKTKYSI